MTGEHITTAREIEQKLALKSGDAVGHHNFGADAYASALGYYDEKTLRAELTGKKVLDVTAGYGLFAHEINSDDRLRGSGCSVISVDPIAVEKYFNIYDAYKPILKDSPYTNLVAAWTDETLPFPDESFDLILDRNGFLLWYDHYLSVFKNAFAEMKRVLRPTGEIRTGMTGPVLETGKYMRIFRGLGLHAVSFPLESRDPDFDGGFFITK